MVCSSLCLVSIVATGLVVGAAVLAALTRPSARFLLTAGSVAAMALAGLYTAAQQYRYRYFAQFEWPTRFHAAHVLAWLAVGLLVRARALHRESVRRRRRRRPGKSPA